MRCNDLQTTIAIIRSNKLIAKGRRSDDGNDHHRNKPGETQRALLERYENVSRRRLPSDAPGGWSVKHDFWQGHYSGAQATTTLIAVPSCCGRKVARFCSSNTKVPPSLIA